MTGDELDAVTAALTGQCFLQGQGEILGGEDGILVPQKDQFDPLDYVAVPS